MKIEIKPNDQSQVGQVIRRSDWSERFRMAITYVGGRYIVGIDEKGNEIVENQAGSWELYEEPKKECEHAWKTNSTEGINIVKRFCTKCNEVDLGDIGNDYPKTGEESSVKCDHKYSGGYIRLKGWNYTQDIRVCFKCKVIDYLKKDIELELPKKNPKLLSPALMKLTGGKYKITNLLFSENPVWIGDDKYYVEKIIWPALDANGNPIQYLVEEE